MEAVMCKQFQRSDFRGQPTAKTYEMAWKEYQIKPGTIMRFNESSKEYRFHSLETVVANGVTWINVLELPTLQLKSYHPGQVRGVVRKRSFNG